MDYQKLNEILGDLNSFRFKNRSKKLNTEVIHKVEGEGSQGDYGLTYEIYPCPFDSKVFISLRITTDSYGDNESVTGITFVTLTTKTVTSYEPIK